MFELSEPWWSLALRGVVVYVVLMVLVRASGKRTIGTFTAFDLVVVILLGEAAQSSLTGDEKSLAGGLIVATTLVALNFGVGFLSARSRAVDKLTEGEPVVIVHRGNVRMEMLRRHNLPESDLAEAVRKAGLERLSDVRLGVLETDGEITIVPHVHDGGRSGQNPTG